MSNLYPKRWLKAIMLTTALTLFFTGSVLAHNDTAQSESPTQLGGVPVKTFNHGENTNRAEWSPDSDMLMTWLNDPNFVGVVTVKIWDVATGTAIQSFNHGTGIATAAWSPDQTRILTATSDGAIHIWDIESGEEIYVMPHDDAPWGATWLSAGDRILSWSADSTARLWDTETGQQIHQWQHAGQVGGALLNHDERRVLTWSIDGAVVVWERASGEEVIRFEHDDWVIKAHWSPDGNRIVSISADNTIRVTDSSTGNQIYNFPLDFRAVDAVWNEDGSVLLANLNGSVRAWNGMTGNEIFDIRPPNTVTISDVQWTPSGSQIAIVSGEMVWIYSAENAAGDSAFRHDAAVRSLEFNQDGNLALTHTTDGTVHVWDTARGEQVMQLQTSSNGMNYTAWSPDDTQIVTTSIDGVINIWQAPAP